MKWSIQQMKNSAAFFMKLSTALLVLSISLFYGKGFAQSPLAWKNPERLDTGIQPSVAVLPSGLVVEFHRSENSNSKVWYNIGTLVETYRGAYTTIRWGSPHSIEYLGERPSVAVTKEGYVVLVYTRFTYRGFNGTVMRYFVGELNPAGDENQTIQWRIKDALFDTGQFAKITFNNRNNELIDVHESGSNSSLYYRLGHFRNPAQGDFELIWDSSNGSGGVKYDDGANPEHLG
jgi:hypothetical protein